MTSILRNRNTGISFVKNLDAFPKVEEDYKKSSAVSGTLSLAMYCFLFYLMYIETMHFLEGKLQFKFKPDTSHDRELKVNIDLTVASSCENIDIDIIDFGNETANYRKKFTLEDTWWELTPDQRSYFEYLKETNSYLREEYHALHEILWQSNFLLRSDMPKRNSTPDYPSDACRIYGSAILTKVDGLIHISWGKNLVFLGLSLHLYPDSSNYNYSHRINKFSFGNPSTGILHPLQGTEKITEQKKIHYKYFLDVVSTDVDLLKYQTDTYQYSAKEFERVIDHGAGSHGMPGIFFKYNINALKIQVIQERDSICQFLVKLCAVVGCIFVTNGLVSSVLQSLWYIISCNVFRENKNKKNSLVNM